MSAFMFEVCKIIPWKSLPPLKSGASFWMMINPTIKNGETRKPTGLKKGVGKDFQGIMSTLPSRMNGQPGT